MRFCYNSSFNFFFLNNLLNKDCELQLNINGSFYFHIQFLNSFEVYLHSFSKMIAITIVKSGKQV